MNEYIQKMKETERLINKILTFMDTIAPNGRDYEQESGFSIARSVWETVCQQIDDLKP